MSKKSRNAGNPSSTGISRRQFIARAGAAAAFPYVIPGSALGLSGNVAPSNRIAFGFIGVGRMGRGDMRELLGFREVQGVAACDVDADRARHAQRDIEAKYADEKRAGMYKGCAVYGDYRELVGRDDIDAVTVVTPDHWHVLPAIAAARNGKDIFLQKPLSLTIREGRVLSDAVSRYGVVFQTGSQQRSDQRFRFACELVRSGRIGKLEKVYVGFGTDPGCGIEPPMPVPDNLDYDFWLGPAPWAPYTEKRVHPQKGYGRPGWLRMRDYSGGMMTGWGAHHLDIGQWGMGKEYSGAVEIVGHGEYPRDGLWDVHGPFHVEYIYDDGVVMIVDNNNRGGVTFKGTDGWVWVTRGDMDARPRALLDTTIGPDEVRLYRSNNHKGNFIDCIKTRAETVAPVEIAHRSCTACILGNIAMELGRKLRWNPETERFVDDPEADRCLNRAMRAPWHL